MKIIHIFAKTKTNKQNLLTIKKLNAMKKILVSLLVSLIAVAQMSAQSSISEKNQKMISREMAKKILKEKPSDVAKDQAKDLKKDKWKSLPGTLPLEYQLNERFLLENEKDESGRDAYIIGSAENVFGGNVSGAKLSATTEARFNAASQFETIIEGWVDEANANGAINEDVANSIKEVVSKNRQTISKKLLRGKNVVQIYREVKNGKKRQYEVTIAVAYEYAYVMKAATQALVPLMGENGNAFMDIVNHAMGF